MSLEEISLIEEISPGVQLEEISLIEGRGNVPRVTRRTDSRFTEKLNQRDSFNCNEEL